MVHDDACLVMLEWWFSLCMPPGAAACMHTALDVANMECMEHIPASHQCFVHLLTLGTPLVCNSSEEHALHPRLRCIWSFYHEQIMIETGSLFRFPACRVPKLHRPGLATLFYAVIPKCKGLSYNTYPVLPPFRSDLPCAGCPSCAAQAAVPVHNLRFR
eukprot:1158261-Pelagomonas_calceolata.AAC.15